MHSVWPIRSLKFPDRVDYVENMWCSLYLFYTRKIPFGQTWSKKSKFLVKAGVNLVRKIKIVSLSWSLVPILIWISGIQWLRSIFLFLTINIFLGQIWSKNSKLFVQSEIWYKDEFEYAIFNGDIYFICFRLKIATLFGKFGPKICKCQFKLKIGT